MCMCVYSYVHIHRVTLNGDTVNPRKIYLREKKLSLQWIISNRYQSFGPISGPIIVALHVSDWFKTCRINVLLQYLNGCWSFIVPVPYFGMLKEV